MQVVIPLGAQRFIIDLQRKQLKIVHHSSKYIYFFQAKRTKSGRGIGALRNQQCESDTDIYGRSVNVPSILNGESKSSSL